MADIPSNPVRRTRTGKATKTTTKRVARKLKGQFRKAAPVQAVSGPVEVGSFHGYITVTGRGTVALPPALRKRYGLDLPGSQVEITERGDGVLELRPTVAIPAGQAWFWTKEWQDGERQVDADYAEGRFTVHDNVKDFMTHLEDLDEAAVVRENQADE